jgi:hypothetical protein
MKHPNKDGKIRRGGKTATRREPGNVEYDV